MKDRSAAIRTGSLLLLALTVAASVAGAINVGDLAPSFTLRDLDGTDHTLTSYRPHPVLLMFLECDAASSITLAPIVESEVHEVYAGQGLTVLGMECRGCTLEELDNFRNQTGVEFPILRSAASTQASYGVPSDSFVLIDGGGIVRYLSLGPGTDAYNSSAVRLAIEELLRDANNTVISTWGMIKSLYN
jgi:peroxiredoxin